MPKTSPTATGEFNICLPLPLCCVSVSGPVIDVFINPVVKAEE